MTKAELVEKAAKDAKVSKVAAAAALNSFMVLHTNECSNFGHGRSAKP